MTAPADPTPWLRCRCVAWNGDGGWRDDYAHRCPQRPDAEDGKCAHCRQPSGPCADPDCVTPTSCCVASPPTARTFVPLTTPCAATRTEVAF